MNVSSKKFMLLQMKVRSVSPKPSIFQLRVYNHQITGVKKLIVRIFIMKIGIYWKVIMLIWWGNTRSCCRNPCSRKGMLLIRNVSSSKKRSRLRIRKFKCWNSWSRAMSVQRNRMQSALIGTIRRVASSKSFAIPLPMNRPNNTLRSKENANTAVSYTHLTLPTTPYV